MEKVNARHTFLLVAIVLVTSSLAFGQGTGSRVTGTVLDEKEAAIPGATVKLTNEATGISLESQTTDRGTYFFDSVQVGIYTVTIEKAGFKKFLSTGNKLDVNQPATVNVTLEVGTVQEVVQVTAAAEAVQTSSSGNFGNTVEQRSLETLPIVGSRGRNPLNFINFQPGVVSGANIGGGVHVHGSRDRAFNFTLDGIDINETSAGGSNFTPLRTNPDMLSEFQVLTSNFTAELGRSSGAQVGLVTRSGSNTFHGTGFEFYRTPRFNANEYENLQSKLPRGQFIQHIFGGSLGGPIIKNKTFFFTNLQLLRTLQSFGVNNLVYTATARQGIFRYAVNGTNGNATSSPSSVDANGNVLPGVNIGTYNIGTRDPRGLGVDPTLSALFNGMPAPNNFLIGDGLNTAGFAFVAPSTERQYDFVIKGDHTFNERNTMYVRYAQGSQTTVCDAVNGGLQIFPGTPCLVDTFRHPKNLAVNYRWSPTPKLTNEFVVGLNRFKFDFATPADQPTGTTPVSFSLNNGLAFPFSNIPGTQNARQLTTYQVVDNTSYIYGAHTFKGGINFRFQRHEDNRTSVASLNVFPEVTFDTTNANVDVTAFGLTSLTGLDTTSDRPFLQGMINNFLGRVGRFRGSFVAASDTAYAPPTTRFFFDARFNEYDFYFQDTWKLRPNFTVDLGLRWEPKMAPRGGGNSTIFGPNRPIRLGELPGNDIKWVEGKLYDNDWTNFGPAVGFAWDPFKTGKTSIRANYRIAYDRAPTFLFSSSIFPTAPGRALGVTLTPNVGVTLANETRLRQGLPTLAPPAGATPAQLLQPVAFSQNSITVIDPSFRSPKSYQWGLSLQREIGFHSVIEVNYIGNRGVGLLGGYDINQVDIFSNGFLDAFNTVRTAFLANPACSPVITSSCSVPASTSPFINALLATDTRLRSGETGSQFLVRQFGSSVNSGSVAGVSESIALRNQFSTASNPATGQPFGPFFFQRYPQFAGALNVIDTNDISRYHALEVIFKRRFVRGLSYQVSYTLAKSMDNRSFDPTFSTVRRGSFQSASSTPFDLRNRRLNFARSDFNRKHALQGYFVYDLPFGKGQRWGRNSGRWLDEIIGGWEWGSIINWSSGRPFTVYSGFNTVSNVVQSTANCNGCSPNMGQLQVDPATGVLYFLSRDQIGSSFNSGTRSRGQFSVPAPGEIGNTGRNFFTGPGFFQLDMTIGKKFRFTERTNLEVRMEAQNLTNHPSFDIPVARITSGGFGDISTSLLSSSRRMQLAVKFNF
ncbi:MAG: carboxypeptidase regulatory-like domain-containing protein [Pyrinomonadaceae bacterium]